MTGVTSLARPVLALICIFGVTACARSRPALPGAVLALDTPAPPARVPIPVYLPEPEEIAPPPVAAAPPPPQTRPRESSSTAKPTDKPPVTTPPVASTETPVPPVLQTTTNIGAVEQKTLALLADAQRNLDLVSYGSLGSEARAQYDRAQVFVRMARSALAIKNYVYAELLADKAASVARLLAKG
jgi:hypothetical protein